MIELKNVRVEFEGKIILDDINYKFEAGNFYLIKGANGSGKSTLLKVLSDCLDITSGSIVSTYAHREISFFDNESYVFTKLSVEDNIQYYCRLFHASKAWRDYIVNKFLNDELLRKKYCMLSEGNKIRVRLACIFLNENLKVVTLDEPLINLDEDSVEEIEQYLQELTRNGKLVICVSHTHFENIERDNIISIKGGKLHECT